MHLVLEAIPFVCLVKLPFDTTFPIQVRFSRVGIAPRCLVLAASPASSAGTGPGHARLPYVGLRAKLAENIAVPTEAR